MGKTFDDFLDNAGTPNPIHAHGMVVAHDMSGSFSVAANTLYATARAYPAGGTLAKVHFHITASTGGNFRAGLYDATSYTWPWPNALLTAWAAQTIANGDKQFTATDVLIGGLYWLAFVADTACTLAGQADSSFWQHGFPIFGVDLSASPPARRCSIVSSFTYAALPATFPALGSCSFRPDTPFAGPEITTP